MEKNHTTGGFPASHVWFTRWYFMGDCFKPEKMMTYPIEVFSVNQLFLSISGWWFGTWFFFHIYISHLTLTHIFQRGRSTTNQILWIYMGDAKSHGSPYPPAISLSKVDHQCWWRAWVSPFRKNAGIPSGSVALACLMIPESSSRWWARRRYRFLNPFKLLRTMSANKPDVCSMAILGSLYLNWRYLPCIRPM